MNTFLAFLGVAAYYKHEAGAAVHANAQLQAEHAKQDKWLAEVDAALIQSQRDLQRDEAERRGMAQLQAWQAESAARRAKQ